MVLRLRGDFLCFSFLSFSLWIRNSHHLKRWTKCPSTLWLPFLSKVCRILMSQFSVLFFFVLSQHASICIIIIPNSLTHLFFSFSLHPKHILFFLSLKPYTFLHDTPYPSLVSPLTIPPFPCYDPLLSSHTTLALWTPMTSYATPVF